MEQDKKKKNFLRIDDPKVNKLFRWVSSVAFAIAIVVLGIIITEIISFNVAKQGEDIATLFPGLESFVTYLTAVFLINFIVFLTIVIYIYSTNRENDRLAQKKAEVDSPLTEAANGHEQQIIDLMISIIKPVPGKKNISTAKAAKFIKALKDLNLMDVNMEGQHLIPWIETVTGFSAGKTSPFNQALKAVKVDDDDVPDYKAQLEQILAS